VEGRHGIIHTMSDDQPRTDANSRERSPNHQYSLSIDQVAEFYAYLGKITSKFRHRQEVQSFGTDALALMAFRVSAADAELLAPEFHPLPATELVEQSPYLWSAVPSILTVRADNWGRPSRAKPVIGSHPKTHHRDGSGR
jgi:hypothetical protein